MTLESGTRLGPYEILEFRGKGGVGEVYRGDTRLNRDVAIKVLPAELAEDAIYGKRLEREAKTIVRSITWAMFLLVALGAAPAIPQELPTDDACSLLAGADLISMQGDEVAAPTTGQDVLVCGTKIRSVADSGTLDVPAGATRIAADGKVLLPGLTDGHIHLFAPRDLDLYLAWGVTTVRNLFGHLVSVRMRDRLDEGLQWGPRMITAGPIVDGDPPVWPGSATVTTAEEARAVVGQQVEAGFDFIKVYNGLESEPFFAIIKAAEEAGVQVGGHVPASVTLEAAVKGGIQFIEHLEGFQLAVQAEDSPYLALSRDELSELGDLDRVRLLVAGLGSDRLEEVAGWMVQHGVWNIPTFVVMERIGASGEQKDEWAATHPQMRTVSQRTIASWIPENDFRLQNSSEERLEALRLGATLHLPIVKALHDAGAELMLGTDTSNPFVFPGYSVHEELQRFVAAGLTPWQALRTATVQPARFLGLEDTFGRVAAGLEADLLLLDANPLEDIANTAAIAGVMSRGRWLDRASLDAKLDAVAQAYGKH